MEIKVLEEDYVDVNKLSIVDRDVLFNTIAKVAPDMQVDNFRLLVNDINVINYTIQKPNEQLLMCRKLIKLAYHMGYKLAVIPEIEKLPRKYVSLKYKGGDEALPKVEPISFDICVLSMCNGLAYYIPPHESVILKGLHITPMGKYPTSLKTGKPIKVKDTSKPFPITTLERLISGMFNNELAIEYNKYYVKQTTYFSLLDEELSNVFDYFAAVYLFKQQSTNYTLEIVSTIIADYKQYYFVHPKIQRNENNKLFSRIEKILEIKFGIDNALTADFFRRHIDELYYEQYEDSPVSKLKLSELMAKKEANEIYRSTINERVKNSNILDNYLNILRQVDIKSYTLYKNIKLLSDFEAAIPVKLLNVIKSKYDRERQKIEQQQTNKCPHVKIYNDLRIAVSQYDKKKLLTSLNMYLLVEKDIVKCTNCGFNICCPHVIKWYEAQVKTDDYRAHFEAIAKYITRVPVIDKYVCSMCNEVLVDELNIDEVSELIDEDEDLKKKIWGEIMSMIRYINGTLSLNYKQIVNTIKDIIYPLVRNYERQLAKSKTFTLDEMKAKSKLNLTIYIFAYFIHLIYVNKDKITLNDFKIKESKKPLVDLIKYAQAFIYDLRNPYIKTISGMTSDIIKNDLINAYNIVSKKQEIKLEKVVTAQVERKPPFINDSMFHYVYWCFLRLGAKIIPMAAAIEQLAPKGDLELKAPTYKMSSYLSFPKIKINKPLPQMTNEILNGRYYYAYGQTVELCKALAEMRQFTPDIPNVEKNFADYRKTSALFTIDYYTTPVTKYSWRVLPLGRIYDEEGRLHKWKKNKCEVCGVLRADAVKLNEEKIKSNYLMKVSMENFYNFYNTRCPMVGFHEFIDDKCKKCGFSPKFTKDDRLIYYRKYNLVFKGAPEAFIAQTYAPVPQLEYKDLKSWKFNFNIVLDICARTKVEYKQFMALGASENIELADIMSGDYIPPEPKYNYNTRLFVLKGYICNLITNYNNLRFFKNILKPSEQMLQFIESLKYSKHTFPDLASLPSVANDINNKIEYFKRERKPREGIEFCLESLAFMLINIIDNAGLQRGITDAFVKDFVKKLISTEKLLIKAGYFNRSLMYADKKEETIDPNYIIEKDTGDDDDEINDPFSNDAIDVEDMDFDPDDDEADPYNVNVGE